MLCREAVTSESVRNDYEKHFESLTVILFAGFSFVFIDIYDKIFYGSSLITMDIFSMANVQCR